MKVSVVIPTRNRRESLHRLLRSLLQENASIAETIIVDASDGPDSRVAFGGFDGLNVRHLRGERSVCKQRNAGIRLASSEYVFLCDDDMEMLPGYLSRLVGFLEQNPGVPAVSGLVAEKDQQGTFRDFSNMSIRQLFWNSFFLLGIWTDLSRLRPHPLLRPLVSILVTYYRHLGNTRTIAGWPLVTNVDKPLFKSQFYGLGASVIRRELLLQRPYDEILDEHGIGDHYGVALRLGSSACVTVLPDIRVLHHKVEDHRLPRSLSYFRRILALDYFFCSESSARRLPLLWSLLGNYISHMIHSNAQLRRATFKAMKIIAARKNPYLLARKRGIPGPVNPDLD